MKILNLLLWVTQFGFSAIFPICAFLVLGSWLQEKFSLGLWVMVVCGLLGLCTAISTVRSCVRTMRRQANLENEETEKPVVYNDHE